MKILFPDVKDPNGGKGHFLHSLYKGLEKLGAEIVFEGAHDIIFGSVRFHTKSRAKRVLRLDGVYHNTVKPNWREKNKTLHDNAEASNLVVCQSHFGWDMVKRFVGVPEEKVRIIGNGSDPSADFILPEKKFEHEFLAVAKWRPHKRLPDIIESFLRAGIPNSGLNVIGSLDDDSIRLQYSKFKNIVFQGPIFDRKLLYGYMKSAVASLHLCWFDCFPNSVVEAICMGCPVICNNTGGTHEIVRPAGGFVLDVDKPYNYQPTDLYNPPKINLDIVAEAMTKCVNKRPVITCEHVTIDNVVKKYHNAFTEVFNAS